MKLTVLILSLLLSLFSGGRGDGAAPACPQEETPYSIAEIPSSRQPADFAANRDICLTAAQGYAFAGDSTVTSFSARSTSTSRRTTSQTKSNFRIIKDGKVVDNNHSHPFLAQSFTLLSGPHIAERYIFALCCLRI